MSRAVEHSRQRRKMSGRLERVSQPAALPAVHAEKVNAELLTALKAIAKTLGDLDLTLGFRVDAAYQCASAAIKLAEEAQ